LDNSTGGRVPVDKRAFERAAEAGRGIIVTPRHLALSDLADVNFQGVDKDGIHFWSMPPKYEPEGGYESE